MPSSKSPARRVSTYKIVQAVLGILFAGYLLWRLYVVLIRQPRLRTGYLGPFHHFRHLVLGSVYALIAIGYTLVYGILRMINFAHGDITMLALLAATFALKPSKPSPPPAWPIQNSLFPTLFLFFR